MKHVLHLIHRIFRVIYNFQHIRRVILSLAGALAFLLIWQGCDPGDNKNDGPGEDWTEEEKQAYLDVESIQNQCSQVFSDLIAGMDTLTAKEQLVQWFLADPSVAWAASSEQGVSVLYQNGMRGGILIDPLEDQMGIQLPDTNKVAGTKIQGSAVIPGKKDAILFHPVYSEMNTFFPYLHPVYKMELPKVGMGLKKIALSSSANLSVLENLDEYGFIHFFGHGYAWPSCDNITEVYTQTGEAVTPETSLKYWNYIKDNKIILLTDFTEMKMYYWVGPEFITDVNDFSKDTALVYGEFCFGFLGGWPSIVNRFAKGAYLAADWSVAADYGTGWGMHLIINLCDTSKDVPVSVDEWMKETPDMAKSYVDENNHTVNIRYAGDGTLTLWKPQIRLEIKSMEVNGAPITVAGNKNTAYTFKCLVSGEKVENLLFIWDFGDGSPPQQTYQTNELSHTWTTEGTFQLKVEVMNINTNETIGIPAVSINIGSSSAYINQYSSAKTAYSVNYSLPSTSLVIAVSPFFRVDYDTLINILWPPEYNYKHKLNLLEKPLSSGETRSYQLNVSLGQLTSTLPGTPSFNKVTAQIFDKNGSNYFEFDGLTPMNFSLATDETHTAAITVTAFVWMGSGIPYEIYPMELTIFKDR